MINFTIKIQGLEEAEKMLKGMKGGFEAAASRAINRGLNSGRAVAGKLVSGHYNIGSGEVKKELKIEKATRARLEGELKAQGNMLPVTAFNPTVPNKPGKGRFIKVAIVRGPKKPLKKAFSVKGKIMEREGDPRYPISPVMAIGVPHMVGSMKISEEIQRTINESTEKNLAHEVQYMLSKGEVAMKKAQFR